MALFDKLARERQHASDVSNLGNNIRALESFAVKQFCEWSIQPDIAVTTPKTGLLNTE